MISPKDFTVSELEEIVAEMNEAYDEERLKDDVQEQFTLFDADGNGYLDRKELKNFLKAMMEKLKLHVPLDDTVVDFIFGSIDKDKNHKIELDELEAYVKKLTTLCIIKDKILYWCPTNLWASSWR